MAAMPEEHRYYQQSSDERIVEAIRCTHADDQDICRDCKQIDGLNWVPTAFAYQLKDKSGVCHEQCADHKEFWRQIAPGQQKADDNMKWAIGDVSEFPGIGAVQ